MAYKCFLDTTDGHSVKAPRRNEPVVLAAADGGDPDMPTASSSEPLDESFLLGSPSLSRVSSQCMYAQRWSPRNAPCVTNI